MAETESGWLLEKMHNGNVHYIFADYVLQWTDDPNKALRLSRREDAEALTTIVEDCEKIAEHEWPGDSPSDAEQLAELRKLGARTVRLIHALYDKDLIPPLMQYEVDGIKESLQRLLNPKQPGKETKGNAKLQD